ncbi:hypothetical protein GRI44_13810 [Altererythrobacter confluentis]|uniref:Uncharacterized protein n=1 Tax=Allopontixanthobacter confluentis TaxID=1849021 RepID=A0A6L7GJS9_9SPHN|nr:hypothetical protein [Allopontixanthobacter confluentis]MXP15825.1 hypothetical protein [Allopontixanthobacter confluentis]
MSHSFHADWSLDLAIEIDRHSIGFLGEFFRASREKRQVIAAYLCAKAPFEDEMERVGDFLRSADHRAILMAAYRDVPTRFRGALRRAGPTVHDLRFYSTLHQLLSVPAHDQIRNCIARLTSLDLTKLHILSILPEPICRANVIAAIKSVDNAQDIIASFHLLVRRGVDHDALAAAICRVRSEKDMVRVWQRWAVKARCDHPVPASAHYHPVLKGEHLNSLALRYRNCARGYLADLVEGTAAFAEVYLENQNAVVHLKKKNGKWILDGLFGPRNAAPPRRIREFAQKYLAEHDVEIISRGRRKNSEFDSLRRLVGEPHFDFDFDYV